jgi:ATP-dependent Clp protease adapter protein ClpS
MDRVQAGYVQLVLHDDEHTRQDFVIGLLRSVFSQSPTDALEAMMTIESKGKAVCGTYRRVVADALLQAAQERIRTAGHQLVMTAEAGDDLGVIVASCAAILQVTSSV